MSASVAVGFSPAVTAVVNGSGSTPAAGDAASTEGGLFAAILSLLGPALTGAADKAEAGVVANLPADVAKVAAPLIDALGQSKDIKASDSGKSLLTDLGDALTAAGDAAASGNPVDPATRKKLEDALDQIGSMLVTLPVAQAVVVAPTVAATGDADVAVDPAAAAPAAPSAPVVSPATPDMPAMPAPAAGEPDTDIDDADTDPARDVTATADAAQDPVAAAVVATPVVPAPTAPAADTPTASADPQPVIAATQPMVAKLAKLVEKLSEDVRATSPVLADKLKAFATELETTGATPQLLEKLGLSTDAATDISQMVAALSAPKPAAKSGAAATVASDFAAPVLSDKGKLTGTKTDDSADPVTPQPQSTTPAPTPDAPAIKPVTLDATTTVAKPAEKPVDAVDAAPVAKADAAAAADPATAATQQAAATTNAAAPAGAARAIHAAYQAPVQQINYPQVAFEVARQFIGGNSRFQIRLDPPELGRIDVKLDMDKHGTVNARMVVERPETLDLMQRDQRALQQALTQAGIDSSKTNLEFSLRQNPFAGSFAGGGNGGNPSGQNGYGTNPQVPAEATEVAPLSSVYRGTATAGGVNLLA